MTAPAHDAAPSHGSLDMLRETAMEQLHMVSWHASLARDQGAATADAGMIYNARRATAHLRFALDALKMMAEQKQYAIRDADERRADHGMTGTERRGERA